MQWLAELCIRRPVLAITLNLAMIVAGLVSFGSLGIDRFPRVDLPTIFVRTVYPGAASEEVETEVSQVLEDAVATVAGIDELRSISSDGTSLVLVTFSLKQDMDVAAQDVRDAIATALDRLPPTVELPVVRKQDLDASPIMTLSLSGPRESRELYQLAKNSVKDVIESASGVGEVLIQGADERAVQVNIDAQRLAAYRMSIMQVRDALARQNAEVPGGRVDAGRRELSLRTMGRLSRVKDFENLVVTTVGDMPVRLADVGETLDIHKEKRNEARFDGLPAVVLRIQRQSGSNTIEVIDAVKQKLKRVNELLPHDVKVNVLQDQSRYIRAAMHEVETHLVVGSLLATAVVLLFMRSWRSTLIAAVAIPTSIIATFAVMKALGFTLNNVTMLALVLMVGVVIDDAIVVLENVFRFVEEEGMDPRTAAVEGTREIGFAVLATTISLVIVFLPVSFLSSVTGRMLYEFGMTATAAIMISMLVSFTLTPLMCSRLLTAKHAKKNAASHDYSQDSRRGFYGFIEWAYMGCLKASLRFRWLVCLLSIAVIYANIPLYQMVRQDYLPTNADESEFEVRLTAPTGATLASTSRSVLPVEEELRKIEGVEHLLMVIGGRGFGSVNSAEIYVRLKDAEDRGNTLKDWIMARLQGKTKSGLTQQDIMQNVRKVLQKFPALRGSVRNLTSFRQGAPVDIDFAITGPNPEALYQFSDILRKNLADVPGLVDIDTTLRRDKPDLLAKIDRERAAALGVDAREVADTLRVAVGGDDRVSRYLDRSSGEVYDVELRLVGLDRSSPEEISQLYIRTQAVAATTPNRVDIVRSANSNERLTRLDNVVSFDENLSVPRIDRLGRQRMVALRANIGPGYSLAGRIEAIHEKARELGLPPGAAANISGVGRELQRSLQDFLWTFAMSFIFMYLVMAAQFEHFIHPVTILASLPLAIPFGLMSLWFGNESLNVYSALGILVLFGVVKKASILQIDHINQLRAHGMDRYNAILLGNRNRLRPILMTTVAFVAGMIPLLVGTGPGAEERRSIAVLAIGGQTFSLLLTLVAVPVIYSILDDFSAIFRFRRD